MARGRSKEMGAPVEELSRSELESERVRLDTMIEVCSNAKIRKPLQQRLREVERRLEDQEPTQSDA